MFTNIIIHVEKLLFLGCKVTFVICYINSATKTAPL